MDFKIPLLLTGIILVTSVLMETSFAAPENGLNKMNGFSHDIDRRSTNYKKCSTYQCYHPNTRGELKVYIDRAWGLSDKDILTGKQSDPYVVVTAIKDSNLIKVTRRTSTKKNTHDPEWRQTLSFGCGYWKHIEVTVYDEDRGGDDNLMPELLYPICDSHTPRCSVKYINNGELYFDILFTPDVNDCHPNPCLNGGTCRERSCSGFYCSCPSGYTGHRCGERYYAGGGGGGGGDGLMDVLDGPESIDQGFN